MPFEFQNIHPRSPAADGEDPDGPGYAIQFTKDAESPHFKLLQPLTVPGQEEPPPESGLAIKDLRVCSMLALCWAVSGEKFPPDAAIGARASTLEQ